MIKVSVIIPVYNGENYLLRCFESLQKQTMKNWQAIFVDDGSIDNTSKILDGFAKKDKRVMVIHKKNAGVSAARNDGIKKASGDYIHFMDVDDIIDHNYYEQMVKFANNADIVCSGFKSNSKYSSSLVYRRMHCLNSLFGKLFWTQALVKSFVWRYLFKTKFIKQNKLCFDVTLISQEDALFVLQAFVVANKVIIIPKVNYHYLFNIDSALNKQDFKHQSIMKNQYEIGEQYRIQYAKDNNVVFLWRFRKIIKYFFKGI